MSQVRSQSVLFLLLASLLWATDGIFRIFAVRKFDALYILLFENMIMALMLLPFRGFFFSSGYFRIKFDLEFS